MGTLNDVVATLTIVSMMILAPVLIRWLVRRIAEYQTVTFKIKDATGVVRVIKLRKNMSPEEVRAISQELTTIIESQQLSS